VSAYIGRRCKLRRGVTGFGAREGHVATVTADAGPRQPLWPLSIRFDTIPGPYRMPLTMSVHPRELDFLEE